MSRFSIARVGVVAALLVLGVSPQAAAQTDTSWSSTRADARAQAEADSLRAAVLSRANFVGFADSCAPGDMRTYGGDSTGVVPGLLRRLELLVIMYGVATPVDNVTGRALMRAVTRFETGGPGPRWDVARGTAPRAFNLVLPMRMLNPETRACVLTPGKAPTGIVLPTMTGFVPPRDSGAVEYVVGYGADGLKELRNYFYTKFGNDTSAVLRHTRVVAHAIWGDYAIVGVQRDAELRGAVPIVGESTGASYAFHRVGADWRLLAIIRNW